MTNKEAILRIEDHIRVHHIGEYPHIYIAEALNMAIDALKEIESIKKERDKAVRILHEVSRKHGLCDGCKNNSKDGCMDEEASYTCCMENDLWEWKGLDEKSN